MTVATSIQNSMSVWQKQKEKGAVSSVINNVYERSLRAKLYHQRQFDRSIENWHMYLGIDAEYGLGQWPAEAVRWMLSKRCHLFTYNLAKVSIERLAASMMKVPTDPEFFPIGRDANSLTEDLKEVMYSDKERCDWESTNLEMIIGGMVFQAVYRMEIDDRWDPLGNIAFRMCLPNSWYGDPMWKTNDMKDLRICWHEQFLMPDMMAELYGDRNPKFKEELENFMRGGGTYGAPGGAVPFDSMADSWGSAEKIIHEYRMERRSTMVEFYMSEDGDVPFPKELEYPDDKIQWLNNRFGENAWQPERVFEKPDFKQVCIKTTICPRVSVNEVLDLSECEIQVGHPPFGDYSFDRINGERCSIIDSVKDMQVNINYSMSMKQRKLQLEGFGGAKGIVVEAFPKPEDAERAKAHHNDPGQEPYELDAAFVANGGKAIVSLSETPQPANEAMAELVNIVDRMWPIVSRHVQAQSGQAQSANEPGILYNSKLDQAEQTLFIAQTRLRNFRRGQFEDWFLQAIQQYSLGGFKREFNRFGSDKKIILNEEVVLPDGSLGIRNDMSSLKEIRCQVIISEKQDTPTKKAQDLQILSDLLGTYANTTNQTPTTVFIRNTIASKVDQLSEADKKVLEELGNKELEAVFNDLEIKILQQQQTLNPQPIVQQPAQPQGIPQAPSQSQQIPVPQPPQAGGPQNTPPAPQGPMPPQAGGVING
jgi:hypothetical protein